MPTFFRNLTDNLEKRLVATSTTVQYEWFTEWQSADGVDNVRAVIKSKNATGSYFQWQLAIQYAAVRTDEPGSPATLGSSQTGSGEYQTGDLSVNTAAQAYFRLGIAYTTAQGGSGVQQGDVALQASWKQLGTDLGSTRVELAMVDTGTKYTVLTRWIPATFMTKVKAAFILTSITGTSNNMHYRLAYQTAGTKVEQPNSWTDAEAGWTQPNGAYDERNTGEITLSTSDMWFRLGVAYGMTSGVDTNTTAVLDAACACR